MTLVRLADSFFTSKRMHSTLLLSVVLRSSTVLLSSPSTLILQAMASNSNNNQMPRLAKPKGGWASAASEAPAVSPNLLSTVPESKVYVANMRYKVKAGKAEEFARGMESVQGQFYRRQPGCIAYVFGLDDADENTVLGTASWSSRELFHELPQHPDDLEKLSAARTPFRNLLDGPPEQSMKVYETKVTYGTCENDSGVMQHDLRWDECMANVETDPNKIPASSVFLLTGVVKAQPGKAEEVARGLEVAQCKFYRQQPGCIEYRLGISSHDPDSVVIAVLWSSKEDFDSCPSNPQDLEALNTARAPYMMMLDGPPEQAIQNHVATRTFGNIS